MFKSPHREDRAQATNQADTPEGSGQDCPRESKYDRKRSYNAERHKFTEEYRERLPSAGWKQVYDAMEVGRR